MSVNSHKFSRNYFPLVLRSRRVIKRKQEKKKKDRKKHVGWFISTDLYRYIELPTQLSLGQ